MPAQKRASLLERRRRHHDDEGEEDGSTVGDVQDAVSSEGSLTSGVDEDIDVSGDSADEGLASSMPLPAKQPPSQDPGDGSNRDQLFRTTADTEAMLNGLKLQEGLEHEELHSEDATLQDLPRSRSQPTEPTKYKTSSPTSPSNRKGHSIRREKFGEHAKELKPQSKARGRGTGNFGNRGYA